MARPRKEAREEGKRRRIPMGAHRYKLQLSDEDTAEFKRRKMVPRWVNDQDGRIQRALDGGYNFVKPEYARSVGSSALHEGNTDEGAKVSKIVSRGTDHVIRAYLMEISEKYYKEDQAEKQKIVDRFDDAIAAGRAGGAEVENAYIPGGNKTAVRYLR